MFNWGKPYDLQYTLIICPSNTKVMFCMLHAFMHILSLIPRLQPSFLFTCSINDE